MKRVRITAISARVAWPLGSMRPPGLPVRSPARRQNSTEPAAQPLTAPLSEKVSAASVCSSVRPAWPA